MVGVASHAQNYKIDFTVSGATNTLDSVHIKNLTQQTELTLGGTDTLHLFKSGTGIIEEHMQKYKVGFHPNPLKDGIGTLSIYQHQAAETEIEIYDMQRKLILSKQLYLQQGHNDFSVNGMPSGFLLIAVKTPSFSKSMKLISIDGKQGVPILSCMQNWPGSPNKVSTQSVKSPKNLIGMQYNDGEPLKLTGYADSLTAVDTITPAQSQTVDFYFEPFGSYPSGTVHCISGGAAVVDVTNPATGKTWMDRNLGAAQQATSSTDSQGYGDLYQWGRFSDGHQCRNSNTTNSQSNSNTPGHDEFIVESGDWRLLSNNNLWQGVNGTNNPCPNGYRLPTYTELNNERKSWSSSDAAGAYASVLKIPLTGRRNNNSGSLNSVGTQGFYWSSFVDSSSDNSYFLGIFSNVAYMSASIRAFGYSVRCIKD